MSIVEFKRAKLLQDAKQSGITINDIARALATIAGVKAVSDFDAGLTDGYVKKAEALLELATEFAQERRRGDWRQGAEGVLACDPSSLHKPVRLHLAPSLDFAMCRASQRVATQSFKQGWCGGIYP